MINTAGVINTFAGTGGTGGYAGDGGAATAARLNTPHCITFDCAGNLYIADYFNSRIRKVTSGGVISTFAGTGTAGYSGDGGAATAAQINYPFGVAVDNAGGLYIGDTYNNVIRFVGGALFNITGRNTLCVGDTATLRNATAGGTWTTSNAAVASITTGGLVTGVAAGAATISYSVTNACGTVVSILNITVGPLSSGTITGSSTVCTGSTTTLTSSVSGGTWSTSAATIASISTTGVVTGMTGGTAIISYSLTSTCGTSISTFSITVNPTPYFDIKPMGLCENTSVPVVAFPDPSAGTWTISGGSGYTYTAGSTGNIMIFTAGSGAAGTVTITYSLAGCSASRTLPIYAQPSITLTSPNPQTYCSSPLTLSVSSTGTATPLVYDWMPTTALSAGTGASVTCSAITATTVYTATVTDNNGCSNWVNTTVMVPSCDMCTGASGVTILGAGGSIGGGTYSGNIYIDNGTASPTINVTGSVTFLNAVVAVAPGKRLVVQPGNDMIVDGSHIYVCSATQTWIGFQLQYIAGVGQANFASKNNSLIEDADIAVDVTSANTTAGIPTIVAVDNTIFNRNKIAIKIDNYPVGLASYPFGIYGAVFTCRDLSGYYNTTSSLTYPYAWPAMTDLTSSWSSGYTVRPSLNIDNTLAKPTGTSTFGAYSRAGVTVKDGTDAFAGIQILGFGATTGAIYRGFTLTGNPLILFDNMNYGIHATNSNLNVYGCYFTYMHPIAGSITPEGDGIFATNATGLTKKGISVNSNPGAAPNYFYNCNRGVNVINYNKIVASYNKFFSDHTLSDLITTTKGGTGVKIHNGVTALQFNGVDVSRNYIVNMVNGIVYTADNDNNTYNVTVNNNHITANTPTWSGFTLNGIDMQVTTASAGASTGTLDANDNTLAAVYNGITLKNFKKRTASANRDTIGIEDDLLSGSINQYGIQEINCILNHADLNYVSYMHHTPPTAVTITGIYQQNNDRNVVTCNAVELNTRGFWFDQTLPNAKWTGNDIIGGYIGYWLNGRIGTQGTSTAPCDNQWLGTWGIPTSPWQTYNAGTISPLFSVLNIRASGGTFAPTFNGTAGSAPLYSFSGVGLVYSSATAPAYVSCAPLNLIAPTMLGSKTTSGNTNLTTDTTGRDSVYECPQKKWMEQMAQWEAIVADSTLDDSSAALQQFANKASHSRYKWLTDIEGYLSEGDIDNANSLLGTAIDALIDTSTDSTAGIVMADGTEADNIVKNYLAYYQFYVKYLQGSLTTTDITKLHRMAYLCPNRDGSIIHRARALNSILLDDHNVFGDDCKSCDGARNKADHNHATITVAQSYKLFPNPTNGRLSIEQSIPDINPIKTEIYDVVGSLVYNKMTNFGDKITNIQLNNFAPGIYVLKLTDSNGKSFHLKFVVQ